jgi:hypothetical protein
MESHEYSCSTIVYPWTGHHSSCSDNSTLFVWTIQRITESHEMEGHEYSYSTIVYPWTGYHSSGSDYSIPFLWTC